MATNRLVDLLKQGFQRPTKRTGKVRPAAIVACARCQDWHPAGKHRRAARAKGGK